MFANYFAAAFRNLMRNKLYSVGGIFGLAIGLCAALMAVVVLRNQITYEHFIPGYERVYLVVTERMPEGRAPDYAPAAHSSVASMLRQQFPEVTAATRLAEATIRVRRDQTRAEETVYWADTNFFEVMPLSVLAGDLQSALRQPESVVLTRTLARKYFGQDTPLGQTIEFDGEHVMTVTAVLEDPPPGTQLKSGIYASGAAAFSELTKADNDPANAPDSPAFKLSARTYVQLSAGAGPERLQAQMHDLMNKIWSRRPPGIDASMRLVRIDEVNLFEGLNPGIGGRLTATALIGALILLLASINFVNLSTVRSMRRAAEVSIRKVSGADRSAIVVQFLGESLLHVALAMCVAVALTEWLLPYANVYLNIEATFEYWRDPVMVACIVGGAVVLAILAGLYPAFVVSSLRPAQVLRGELTTSPGAGLAWQSLVVLQFAILIGLTIAAAVVYKQQVYATTNSLRVDTDQILHVESPCKGAFKSELQRLPGVRGVACSGQSILYAGRVFDNVRLKDGGALAINLVPTEAQLLELYGLQPVAGRFLRSGASGESAGASVDATDTARFVINETAVKGLGFASAAAAIGQPLTLSESSGEIVGVVPDFSLESVKQKINPSLYFMQPQRFSLVTVKLSGQDIPETLAAIDRLWTQVGNDQPIKRYFLNEYIQNLYIAVLREAQVFAIFAVLAVLLAGLGLFSLTAAITDRRTKEIGTRKAMGAGTSDIMRLLLWQFTQPVLWANLVAWPAAAYLMSRWLQGFAYHIELSPWLFVMAALIAVLVAQLTVASHCYMAARRNPVYALRHV